MLPEKKSDNLFENVRFTSDEETHSRIRTSSLPFYGLQTNHMKHSARQDCPRDGNLNKKPCVLDDLIKWLKKMLDYCLCCITCGCYKAGVADIGVEVTNSELMYNERDAVHSLLVYLDSGE